LLDLLDLLVLQARAKPGLAVKSFGTKKKALFLHSTAAVINLLYLIAFYIFKA
jgi:hypothetical protein